MKILVTGCAGFIGAHLTKALIQDGHSVLGIDNLNSYYPPKLKRDRLQHLCHHQNFSFLEADIAHQEISSQVLTQSSDINVIVHLAAQAGVRYSLENPRAYIESNLVGFYNILELAQTLKTEHFVFASSSSIYGNSQDLPLVETTKTDTPISLYAATKKSNELIAHSYSHLYNMPITGLRYFTVYGPWGRPDMAPHIFTKAIFEGSPIKVFNNGNMLRDFSYIDDVVAATTQVIHQPPKKESDKPPFDVINIASSNPIPLLDFITTLEQIIGKSANKEFLPIQPGDVQSTHASTAHFVERFGNTRCTSLATGLEELVAWYRTYYL